MDAGQSGLGSKLSIIIDGKTGERREEREGTDLGFDGTGQGRTGSRVNNRAVRQIKLIQTTTSPLLSPLEINI